MKNIIKMLIGGIVGVGIILLFLYILGIVVAFIESHLVLIIPIFVIVIIAILKI